MDDLPLIWDACGLLNLSATGRAGEILVALGCPSYLVAEVYTGETLFLRSLPEEDPHGGLIPVDLSDLFKRGLLQDVRLTPAEQDLFVEYAQQIDDGEARTAAVAVSRGLRIATDDRGAIRFLRSLPVPPSVLTTPEWLANWADAVPVDRAVLGSVLRRVELCARYHPRRTHPLHHWWFSHAVHP